MYNNYSQTISPAFAGLNNTTIMTSINDQPASVVNGPSMTFDEITENTKRTVKDYLAQNPSSEDPVIASLIKAMQPEKYHLLRFMIVTEQNSFFTSSTIIEESFGATKDDLASFLQACPIREAKDTAVKNPFGITLRYAKTVNNTYVGKFLKSSFSQDMSKDLNFGFWFGSSDEFLIKELFEDFISEYGYTLLKILDENNKQ